MDGHPVLPRNVNPDENRCLELKLAGSPAGAGVHSENGPRDAVGATLYVTANGMKQRQDVSAHQRRLSFFERSPPALRPGASQTVDAIEVHWPDGKVENFTAPGVDRILTLTKGTGK